MARASSIQRLYEPSFVDRLRYHLDIETRGMTAVRMIFTPTTNEELYAEIEGKVTAINNNGTATIYNEISVTSRSYYNFFKRFDARGKLNFVGPWDNPELNIRATYEGYRQLPPQRTTAVGVEGPTPPSDTRPEQKVIVELHITGTRYEPKLSMGMKVQIEPGREPENWASYAKGGDIQSAISSSSGSSGTTSPPRSDNPRRISDPRASPASLRIFSRGSSRISCARNFPLSATRKFRTREEISATRRMSAYRERRPGDTSASGGKFSTTSETPT